MYSLFFSKMIFKAFLYEIIPICAAAQQAMLAALKHSWTEGAFAEPSTPVCSLDACHVPAWKLQGHSYFHLQSYLCRRAWGHPLPPAAVPEL